MPGMKLHFTIRDLLWLAFVIAVALGGGARNRQMAETITRLRNAPPSVSISDDSVERAMQGGKDELQ